ncbi:unnamed protein product [Anisakis simplex]|uniref:Spartin (inferred by orthology to a human protein) n=1 Tax=Anisakis simplex TaxID=6269 RepID=A0A0M3KCF9_ANISI|nr:unnamed protein product [Anisakis simplex]
MTSCSPNIDDLFAEAFACFEQGLCYDEINDYENAIIIYERGLNLVKEAELGKNAKKSALYKEICTSGKRVEKRLKKLKKEKTPTQLKRSLTEPEKEKPDEWVMVDKASIGDEDVKHELREQLESINEGEAELVFFIPDGVQLFIIEGDSTSVPTYPCPLEIFRFNKQTKLTNDVQAEAFIKVSIGQFECILDFRIPSDPNTRAQHFICNSSFEFKILQ